MQWVNAVNWNILVTVGKESKQAIPQVAASERGAAQLPKLRVTKLYYSQTVLEKQTEEGENSPVDEIVKTRGNEEYGEARGTLSEERRTISEG